ncbi:MAG: class I SAM-dependent methyltransferase, partial [Myxococcales bacterium]|nr:class I SAM-dependent methyltransferase [Myxococcales bacterium]
MTDETKDPREGVRRIARKALAEGRPLEWFEEAYRARAAGEVEIPWSDREPNAILVSLLGRGDSKGRRALVVGAGDGQDALWLAGRGYRVTAFDIAPTAVAECRARHGESGVEWEVANLLAPP